MRTELLLTKLIGLTFLATACSSTAESSESSLNGQTRATVCSPEEQAAAFERMVSAPIVPPRMFGGLDIAGSSWTGATVEDAEQTLCQASALGGDVETKTYSWGPNGEVLVSANRESNKIDFIQLNRGYRGTLEFRSRADGPRPNPFGQHTYSLGLDRPLQRDGQTWAFDWSNAKQATELFDAMMATFAPDLPSTQDDCTVDGSCVARMGPPGEAYFGARPLGFYFHVPDASGTQPAPSTPDFVYEYFVKTMPFSSAAMTLKLDAEGPIATIGNLGDIAGGRRCTMQLGMTYGVFLDGCVNVSRDEAVNAQTRQKLLGGASNKDGIWAFDVVGVRPNFTAREGEAMPASDAKAAQLELDLRSSGKVLNDYAADRTTLTLTGTGAVYREYARLVQKELHQLLPPNVPRFGIGAPECLLPAGADPATWHPAEGCTGLEQMITPALPDTADAGVNTMSVGPQVATTLGFRSVLKPGDLAAVFCADPGTFHHCGHGPEGLPGRSRVWQGTLDKVTKVLGKGSADNLPVAARSVHFYVALWSKALVKYLNAAALAPTDLSKPELDRFTPAAGDIALSGIRDGGFLTVSYKNLLSISLLPHVGHVEQFVFKR